MAVHLRWQRENSRNHEIERSETIEGGIEGQMINKTVYQKSRISLGGGGGSTR